MVGDALSWIGILNADMYMHMYILICIIVHIYIYISKNDSFYVLFIILFIYVYMHMHADICLDEGIDRKVDVKQYKIFILDSPFYGDTSAYGRMQKAFT